MTQESSAPCLEFRVIDTGEGVGGNSDLITPFPSISVTRNWCLDEELLPLP